MQKKHFSIFLLITFLVFLPSVLSFAQEGPEKELEITYPEIPKVARPTTLRTAFPEYIRYLFHLFIMLSGIVAFGSLVWGGVQYLISGVSPDQLKSAKDRIFFSIIGLVIVFGSYLILNTINPQLVILKEIELEPIEGLVFYSETCAKKEDGESKSFVTDTRDIGFDARAWEFKAKPGQLKVTIYEKKDFGAKEGGKATKISSNTQGCQNVIDSFPSGDVETVRSVKFAWNVPGVYLCTDVMEAGKCKGDERLFTSSADTLEKDLNEKIRSIRFQSGRTSISLGSLEDFPPKDWRGVMAAECANYPEGILSQEAGEWICTYPSEPWYGAVLHEMPGRGDRKGKCEVFTYPDFDLCDGTNPLTGEENIMCKTRTPSGWLVVGPLTSSVTVFRRLKLEEVEQKEIRFEKEKTDEGVWFCDEPKYKNCWGPFTYAVVSNVEDIDVNGHQMPNDSIDSFYIPDGKNYIVILFDAVNFGQLCQPFSESKDSLRPYPMGECGSIFGRYSCVSSFIVLPREEK